MRDFKWERALNQEERREKASYVKDGVCRSPEPGEVGTDRAQEERNTQARQWMAAGRNLQSLPCVQTLRSVLGMGKAL